MPLTLDPTIRQVPLQERLESLRARCRRIVVLRNGSGVALVGIVLVALFGWLDWRFHLPALVRALALVGTLIGIGYLTVRWVVAPWRKERGLLSMAVRVERKYPELNDSLISAIQFLEMAENELLGSQELRQEAIEQAVAFADGIDFNTAVRSRGLKRAVFGFIAAVGGAIAILNSAPAIAETALTRLFVPFGSQKWPAKTTIEIVAPESLPFRMARGESFELRVVIRGVVPHRVKVGLWLEGGVPVEQIHILPKHDQTPSETTFSLRIESNRVPRSFRFRMLANDADTGWQSVAVVPPPALVPRDGRPSPQIDLRFPAYTQLDPVELPDGGSAIEAVSGTRVRIRAAVDRPISQVSLRFTPEQPRWKAAPFLASLGGVTAPQSLSMLMLGREIWNDVPVRLSGDGQLIDIDFIPYLPGPYVLRIEDETGLGANRVFDIRLKLDAAPTVEMIQPEGNEALSFVHDAEFRMSAIARDPEFALRKVFLEYRTGTSEAYRRIESFDSDRAMRIIPNLPVLLNSPIAIPSVPFRRIQAYTLAQILSIRGFRHAGGTPLREGDVLRLRVGADDFDNVYLNKKPGFSREIEIQIVSTSSLDAALQLDLAGLRNTLLELHDQQQLARSAVRDSLKQLRDTGRIRPEDRERIQKAEQSQQLLRGKIKGENDGVLARLARMKNTIDDNKLPRSAITERIEAVRADLQRLADEELDPVAPLLDAAINEREKGAAGAPKPPLERAERHQREIEETLQGLLERIEPWSGAGEVRGEARSILSELRGQMDNLDALRNLQTPKKMAGSPRVDLPDEMKNRLDREAIRPERMAERIRRMLEKMERLADEKESAIKNKLERARVKETEAKSKEEAAGNQLKGSTVERSLREQASKRRDEAQSLRDSASALQTELDALRNALKQAGAADLRKRAQEVAPQVRDNQLGDARANQKSIADKLEKIVNALDEKPKSEDNDLLQRKRKDASDHLEKLIGGQELLQKKIDAAKQTPDSQRRTEELQKRSREQERLRNETLDLAQQLSRAGAENEAQDLRRAARQMDAAREQLDRGQSPDMNIDDALRHLDEAQEHLDKNRDASQEELQREKLQQAADQIRALRDRQKTANDEEKRLHAKVELDRGWKLALAKESLPGLIEQQGGLVKELRGAIEKRFGSSPVFGRMLRQAADAMDESIKRLEARKEDVLDQLEGISAFDLDRESKFDAGIRTQQELALKRLDQLLEALKPEKDMPIPPPKKNVSEPKTADPPKKGPSDALPPLAELKALRLLQADVAERTASFDRAHPDRSKMTDEEAAELDSLRKMQIDIAELVREITANPMTGEQP